MRQDIIIKKEDYLIITEDEYIDKLKVEYRRTSFSTYDQFRPYLHIQVGEYDDFNLYIEIDDYQAEKLLKQLQEQVNKVRFNY